jgi:hypothetical protein
MVKPRGPLVSSFSPFSREIPFCFSFLFPVAGSQMAEEKGTTGRLERMIRDTLTTSEHEDLSPACTSRYCFCVRGTPSNGRVQLNPG